MKNLRCAMRFFEIVIDAWRKPSIASIFNRNGAAEKCVMSVFFSSHHLQIFARKSEAKNCRRAIPQLRPLHFLNRLDAIAALRYRAIVTSIYHFGYKIFILNKAQAYLKLPIACIMSGLTVIPCRQSIIYNRTIIYCANKGECRRQKTNIHHIRLIFKALSRIAGQRCKS